MNRQRAYPLVVVLLSLASLVGFTSAMNSDDLTAVRMGAADSGPADDDFVPSDGDGTDNGDDDGTAADGGSQDGSSSDGDGSGPTRGTGPGRRSSSTTRPGGGGNGGGGTVSGKGLPPLKIAYLVPDFAGTGSLFGETTPPGTENSATAAAREFKAFVDDVNARDLLRGRKVEGRRFVYSVAEQMDENGLIQSCVEIAEDYKAHYVIDTHIMGFPSVAQCFAQRGVVMIGPGFALTEDFNMQLHPYFATTDATMERAFTAAVPKLQELAYFDDATLGVFLDDTPHLDRGYNRVLKPALDRAGINVAVVERAKHTNQEAIQSAVLKFQDAGVTHILFVATVAHFATFSAAAEGKTPPYRPRYGFLDYFTVASSAAVLGLPEQMKNSVAVSACNYLSCVTDNDDRASDDTTTPFDRNAVTPGLRRCLDELSRVRGVDYYRPGEAGASDSFPWICNNFLLWRDVAERTSPEMKPAQFAQALRSLGSYVSTRAYATDFSDGRRSGSTHFAAGVFQANCKCFVRATAWTRP